MINLVLKSTAGFLTNLGTIHELESLTVHSFGVNQKLFSTHWSQLAIIWMWCAGNIFHIGWTGNYAQWLLNPVGILPIAHSIWDPNFSSNTSVQCLSGLYHWLFGAGYSSLAQLYCSVLALQLLAVLSLILARLHGNYNSSMVQYSASFTGFYQKSMRSLAYKASHWIGVHLDASSGSRLNIHQAMVLGSTSLGWAIHLAQVKTIQPMSEVTGTYIQALAQMLTFTAGLDVYSASLPVQDQIHHHIAVGIVFVWSGHVFRAVDKSIGHRLRDNTTIHGRDHSLAVQMSRSLHLQLSLASSSLGVLTTAISQVILVQNPYPGLAFDSLTSCSLYVHHSWLGSLLTVAGFVHGAIYLQRDLSLVQSTTGRILQSKAALISHLSWLSLWLGFHLLLIYIHNDSVVAFGKTYHQLLIEPLLAQSALCFVMKNITLPLGIALSIPSLTPGDTLAQHSACFGLHVTALILLKGSLDGVGSKLMPDKSSFGFGFACDGPARGGTCDISAWDSFYLALFWLLNSEAWLLFYSHWKLLTASPSSMLKFQESASYLNGWFRDYLWYYSSNLIPGYDVVEANDLAVWDWLFLAAHLVWATGFMFLISWRGYWQELIESLCYMHLKTVWLVEVWSATSLTPVALSIVQARLIGLVHFAVGFILTYAAFIISATS